jgi:pilus assembly protein CpaF
LSYADVEAEIGDAIDYVVHVARQPGRRAIREVLRVDDYDRRTQRFQMEYVFRVEEPAATEVIPC